MKKMMLTFTIFFFTASIALSAEKKNQYEPQQSTRYQIVPTEYNYTNLNGANTRKVVLKIDSFTGKTWILRDDNL